MHGHSKPAGFKLANTGVSNPWTRTFQTREHGRFV